MLNYVGLLLIFVGIVFVSYSVWRLVFSRPKKTVSYIMEVDSEFEFSLKGLSGKKGISSSELTRQALALYAFLNERAAGGDEVVLLDQDDRVVKKIEL